MSSARRKHMRTVRQPSPRGLRALAPRPVGWRTTDADEIAVRLERARELLGTAQRKLEMAGVLRAGGFPAEAVAPAREAVDLALAAVAIRHALAPEDDFGAVPETLLGGEMLVRSFVAPPDLDLVRRLRAGAGPEASQTEAMLDESRALLPRLADAIGA